MKNIARIAFAWSLALGGLGAAQARPVIIEESAVLAPPPGIAYVRFGSVVGTNGEYALVTGDRPPALIEEEQQQIFDALLYRRVNGNWIFQRILAQGTRHYQYDYHPVVIGMKGTLASAELSELRADIFRFNGTDWVPAGSASGPKEVVSIDGERLLYGVGESWNGRVLEPNGTGWNSYHLAGQPRQGDNENLGGPVDLLGDRAILGTPQVAIDEPQRSPSTSAAQARAGPC